MTYEEYEALLASGKGAFDTYLKKATVAPLVVTLEARVEELEIRVKALEKLVAAIK